MKPQSKALVRLCAWMIANDLVTPSGKYDTRELARRYKRRSGPVKGVRERHTPPYAGMRAIVAGEAVPRWDTRVCLDDVTDGYVKPDDWDVPAEVEP